MFISAAVLALATLSTPVASTTAAYAGESVTASKGHATPARVASRASAPVACHPDPMKGRACRHLIVQAEQADGKAVAVAEADVKAAPRAQ